MSTQEMKLKAIADAIREKEGSTEPIPANDFPARILAIPTGGSLPDNVHTITLTAAPADGGSVAGGGTASDGMTLTVSASPASGFSFNGWTEDGETVSADTGYTFTVNGDKTLTAAFAEESASRLPDGYTELEYIQTKVGTSIKTDVNVKPTTARIICDIEPVEQHDSVTLYIFNGWTGFTYASCLALQKLCQQLQWFAGNVDGNGNVTNGKVSYNLTLNTRITIDMDTVSKKINIGKNEFIFSPTSSSNNANPLRFGWNSRFSTSTAGLPMKIYYAKAYTDGDLNGDFVPCKNESGKVGLFNLITGEFCTNDSTANQSEPIAGPAVQG